MPLSENNCRIPIFAQLVSLVLVELGIYLDYHTNISFTGFVVGLYSASVCFGFLAMFAAPAIVIKNCYVQKQRYGILKVFTACLLSVALLFTIARASQ